MHAVLPILFVFELCYNGSQILFSLGSVRLIPNQGDAEGLRRIKSPAIQNPPSIPLILTTTEQATTGIGLVFLSETSDGN
jgi:hypothetical protein